MPVGAKICGLSSAEAVAAALAGGASHLGFLFHPGSPREVSPEGAARLAGPARGRALIVAVVVDPSDDLLDRLRATLAPDLIQLHGKESPTRVAAVRARAGAATIKALGVVTADDLALAADYESVADHLMFDARAPADAARPGGHGAAFDWSLLAGRRYARPWLLAGGLDPWNVAEAVARTGAPIVDVSTGVERGPGVKDPALIAAFLDAVRRI